MKKIRVKYLQEVEQIIEVPDVLFERAKQYKYSDDDVIEEALIEIEKMVDFELNGASLISIQIGDNVIDYSLD